MTTAAKKIKTTALFFRDRLIEIVKVMRRYPYAKDRLS